MTRRQFAGGFASLLACARSTPLHASERPISFGVFSLFEPREMILNSDRPLLFKVDERRFAVFPDDTPVSIRGEGESLRILFGAQTFTATRLQATSPTGGTADLILAVPPTREQGGIRREFQGSFEVDAVHGLLQPIISMDTETAVGSIVDAEGSRDAPSASLMAQAVASRSFLLGARTAHTGFDFCDTTHCQFLRGPAPAGSPARTATARAVGLCLYYDGRPLAAMYSRSCSGRTCSLDELRLPVRDYPYYPVDCEFCLHHPEAWVREFDDEAEPLHGERERIAYSRIHGWSALPSSSFVQQRKQLEGRGIGHGLGLCQRGAMAMARAGIGFDRILAHYYPNTNLAPKPDTNDLIKR
jgi:peptidoglycan hydrolase-like amidase